MAHFVPGIGGTLDAIQSASNLPDDVVIRSVEELWQLSFLEVGKSLSLRQRRYYLHALTQYFVMSDVLQFSG